MALNIDDITCKTVEGVSFPVAYMTYQQYMALPDYSVSEPIDRHVGDIGKIPQLCFPDERLINVCMGDVIQIMHCVFTDEGS